MDKFQCVQCGVLKFESDFCKAGEHIVPYGFGNDGNTGAVLKNKICDICNQKYGDVIDKPFLRHVSSREIQAKHGMKRRKSKAISKTTGSGIHIRLGTSIAYISVCIKIRKLQEQVGHPEEAGV